jgi:BolA family transcriptional regulator, general stress-responsive regulator
MNIQDVVHQKLTAALTPDKLTITDQSDQHAGHSGNTPGAAHITVKIISEKFKGLNEVQRQRLVFKTLAEEMKGAIHALVIEAKTKEEVDV